LFPLGSLFAYRGTQNGWELLSDYLRGHHYRTDEAVQEAVRSWNEEASLIFYNAGRNA
jgi:hypothetical protein